jgi:phosphoribosylformimino-5-aminoimidazole carboxamide ribotide isomerase
VVDLNGAVQGESMNAAAVNAILKSVSIPVQLGGGIRNLAAVERWIEAGVSRVILGTIAVRDPELVKTAARRWPEQIAVAVDVRDGKVAVDGWTGASDLDPIELSKRFEDAGVAALIVTDIGRDGAMTGVNVDAVGALADAVSIPVIASGGVASVEDIRLLQARPGVKIAGAVLGRALYNGAIRPAEVLAIASRKAA